ncbi:hypothetical protein [Virgibacillus oceani]|uniref:Uncharacterized protein n=1 Tax=Virgibacillus oceani TaxID=1479511 RepID=A0A917HK73_9BACI|nr:hypothetical protein [Virgibacillus oceani]GGG81251.1 hypothetical protein GCM10011398_28320 [Virgibacillus oceani]
MNTFYDQEMKSIAQQTWKLDYDDNSNTAKLVNERGEEMDIAALGLCIDAFKHTMYQMEEMKIGKKNVNPLDEFTKKRLGVQDYQLIIHETAGDKTTSAFEVYSDEYRVFTMDYYHVVHNRKVYDYGFLAFLNEFDCKKLLKPLSDFVNRCQ